MAVATSTVLATAAIAGTAMTAYGQYQQGVAAEKAGEYNQKVADQSAKQIAINKKLVARQYDREKERLYGESVANVAKSGIGMSGSPLEVISDSITDLEMDKEIELYNLETERLRTVSAGEMAKLEGKSAKRIATAQAFGTVLKGGAGAYTRYFGVPGGGA